MTLKVVKHQTSPIEVLVNDFLGSRRALGLSDKTLDIYSYPLKRELLPFCQREGIKEIEQLNSRALERLSMELQERTTKTGKPLSRHSIKTYLSAVNTLLRWAAKEGEKVAGETPKVKVPKRVLETLTRDEIDAMERQAFFDRDKLIVRLLADTGMRVGELVKLRVGDLLTHDGQYQLRLRGKGDKERLVGIPTLGRRVARFVRSRPADMTTDRIFVGLRRPYARLNESGVQQMLRLLAKTAGIQKRVYPHLLRHSFATYFLAQGGDSVVLAKLLGHTSLAMIQRTYAHLTSTDEYNALSKLLMKESD